MGGKIVVPEADMNINRVVKAFKLTPKDISDFWKLFQKLDKEKTGLVSLADIFDRFEMQRNIFTDCLLEVLEIDHEGDINFSDFLIMVTTYCFFEPEEILKFCFYCFDQDKTGYFSVDDLNNLMNVVHNVERGKTVTGNVKGSWVKLTFKNDQLDFKEFTKIHNAFPRLFGPAFRLQQLMMIHTMGEVWWTFRKRALQDQKDAAAIKMAQLQKKKEDRAQAKKNRKIKKNMGLVKYYLCPWWRVFYDPSASAYDKMTAEQKKEADRQMKIARRQAELRMKNPETPYWKKYEEKIALELAELEKKPEVIEESKEPENKVEKAGTAPTKTSAVDTTVVAVVPTEEKKIGLGVFDKYDAQVEQSRSPTQGLTKTVVPEVPKAKGYLEEKLEGTSRMREDRAVGRAERRQQRQRNVNSIGKYEV